MSYFVYDPNPIGGPSPVLVGPFDTEDEAWSWANVMHPDDGNGNAEVLKAVKP